MLVFFDIAAMPQTYVDTDQPKQRLTSKLEIAQAILRLTEKGVPVDDLLTTLTRSFYIDLDMFNEILRHTAMEGDPRTLDSQPLAAPLSPNKN